MSIRTAINNGPSSNRVDIVILGDGYTASELSTTFTNHANNFINYLFDGSSLTEPFGHYQNFFNAHLIDVTSAQSGADDPITATMKDTAFNGTFNFNGVTDRLLYVDEALANAALVTGLAGTGITAEMQILVVNTTKYGGGGGNYAVYSGGNAEALEIALHEVGHVFGGLADEYGGSVEPYMGMEPTEVNMTKDSTGAKWNHWKGFDQPGIGVIGAYEGGNYFDTGTYRPSETSKMNVLNNPFDVVSREALILKLYAIVDPLDNYSYRSATETIDNPTNLWVDIIDDNLIEVEWFVDGVATLKDHISVTMEQLGITSGKHNITVKAFDNTEWVRQADRSSLEQEVSWTVNLYSTGTVDLLAFNEQLSVIYFGYFGRAGDEAGFNFWSNFYNTQVANGLNKANVLNDIANKFQPQAETLAIYPALGLQNPDFSSETGKAQLSTFLDDVYQNLFNRTPDPGGKTFWSEAISNNSVGLGEAIMTIANGSTGSDIIIIQHKAEVALYFTNNTAAANKVADAEFVALAKEIVGGTGVLGSSSDTAKARTDAYVALALNETAAPAMYLDTSDLGANYDTSDNFELVGQLAGVVDFMGL